MIKRVIFDMDNTLMPWKKEYDNEIGIVLKELGIEYTEEENKKIRKALIEYENNYYTFNTKLMIDFINKYTKKNYPEELIEKLMNKWSKCAPEKLPESTIKVLEYTKSKYEVVVLTDWYKEQQVKRLEKAKILKYFQEVYAAEIQKENHLKKHLCKQLEKINPKNV